MCMAARPRALHMSMRSLTWAKVVCVLSKASKQSFLPQKTAAVSGVQPFWSRKFRSAPFLSAAVTSAPVKLAMLRTSSWLPLTVFALPLTSESGIRSRRRLSMLLVLDARKAGQSNSLLWRAGLARCISKCLTKDSSDLSTEYNNVLEPVGSRKLMSARFSMSCSANCSMSGKKRVAPRAFSTSLSLRHGSYAFFVSACRSMVSS
mmetsp:Transcript_76375/g.218823  ORF Transcript_76375/g.218823 Transcript_76375/m.218823 type:complete len:205 (-) Transcript_76375:599-1213(-)